MTLPATHVQAQTRALSFAGVVVGLRAYGRAIVNDVDKSLTRAGTAMRPEQLRMEAEQGEKQLHIDEVLARIDADPAARTAMIRVLRELARRGREVREQHGRDGDNATKAADIT